MPFFEYIQALACGFLRGFSGPFFYLAFRTAPLWGGPQQISDLRSAPRRSVLNTTITPPLLLPHHPLLLFFSAALCSSSSQNLPVTRPPLSPPLIQHTTRGTLPLALLHLPVNHKKEAERVEGAVVRHPPARRRAPVPSSPSFLGSSSPCLLGAASFTPPFTTLPPLFALLRAPPTRFSAALFLRRGRRAQHAALSGRKGAQFSRCLSDPAAATCVCMRARARRRGA